MGRDIFEDGCSECGSNFREMTGDTNLVSDILLSMTSKQRAAILAEMDPVYAAKLTVIMYPGKG